MATIKCLIFLTLFSAGLCEKTGPTPVEKVITLITDLKAKVHADGIAEATAYQTFADECLAQTTSKSQLITDTTDSIDGRSTDIASKSSDRDSKNIRLKELIAKIEQANKDKTAMAKKCAKEEADNHQQRRKIGKSTDEVNNAIKHVCRSAKKNGETVQVCADAGHATLLQVDSPNDLEDSSPSALIAQHVMEDAMDMVANPENKAKLVQKAMLQGSSSESDATAGGANGDLVGVLAVMRDDFVGQTGNLTAKISTNKVVCDGAASDFTALIELKEGDRNDVSGDIQELNTQIGTVRGQLLGFQTTLSDADVYMKDLTTECQSRAKDWDQRSTMRADEAAALQTALNVLTGNVQAADTTVNQRNSSSDRVGLLQNAESNGKKVSKPVSAAPQAMKKPTSFLQQLQTKQAAKKPAVALLRQKVSQSRSSSFLASSQESRKSQALGHLASEGQRIGSLALVELAQGAQKDQFFKIKKLIDALILRLVHEATSESSKTAFCKGELAKAKKERDYRWKKSQKLASKTEGLLAYEEELTLTILTLTSTTIPAWQKETRDGAANRKTDQSANMQTLQTGRGGLVALQSAIKTLKDFYKKAAKASSFIQESTSPLGEGMAGKEAGFQGSSNGNQKSSHAIFGLLETIESDFQRTIRKTEAAERQAARDWVKASQDIAVSQSESEATLKFSNEELVATKSDLKMKLIDLTSTQGLLDNALKTLLKLKPTCIDSGMSYKQRVDKREQEMTALKSAMCMLDQSEVETDCTQQEWTGA